jgi:putative Holliday junction resolvase
MTPKTRIISIDYGMKRVGLAVSDERKIIATPWRTVLAERKLNETAVKIHQEIQAIEKEKGCHINTVVVGNPLHMNGKVGVLADEVKHFIEELKKHYTGEIVLWDERLTSVQAERALLEGSMTRKKRSQNVDVVAATIILQNYLDKLEAERSSKD